MMLRYNFNSKWSRSLTFTIELVIVVGMCQESSGVLFIRHPKVSTLLALHVNSTVIFEQTALPEMTSTGLVRLRDRLGVPAYYLIQAV